MDSVLIEKFMANLERRSSYRARLRISGWNAEQVNEFLLMAYRKEVEDRRSELIEDETTLSKLKKAALWLTGDYKPGLLLYGGVGNGKTTLAKAICKTIGILCYSSNSSERKEVFRISALEVAKCASDPDAFTRLRNQELLFIDDIGTEPASIKSWGNEISPVTELLFSRYDRQQFTIITSNLNDKELEERYGLRIADRMAEMFDKLHYSNRSYRR